MTPDVRADLRHLVDQYADAVDRRDAAAVRGLFTEHGVLRVQADGAPVESERTGDGLEGVIDALAGYERTLHHNGGCVFEGDGEEASGRVTCLAHHYERTASGPVDLVMMIRYHDRYAKRPEGWRFAERRVAVEWTELHPAHPSRRVRS